MDPYSRIDLSLPEGQFCIDLRDDGDGLRAYITVLDGYQNKIPYQLWMNSKNIAFDWDDPAYFTYVTMPEVASILRLMTLAFRWSIADSLLIEEDNEDQQDEDEDDE